MDTGEKSNLPPLHAAQIEPTAPPFPYAPGAAPGEYGAQQPVQYPAPNPPSYYPPGQQQQGANVAFVPAAQNVRVVNVRTNLQIPDVYPGIAFCKFIPGIVETSIRLSLMVRLSSQCCFAGVLSLMHYPCCIFI